MLHKSVLVIVSAAYHSIKRTALIVRFSIYSIMSLTDPGFARYLRWCGSGLGWEFGRDPQACQLGFLQATSEAIIVTAPTEALLGGSKLRG